ncbi:MAG TPA: hypothetical protein VNX22_03000 [Acidobacteriaceae bacterium]|nr:hypothetical protein [Acidobacteriaceae bacterium]
MFGSVVLDVAIGMAFVFLLLSLIASVIQEILASIVQARAANLQRGLRSLLSGDSIEEGVSLVDSIYNHGLVRGLYQDPAKDYLGTKGRLSDFRLKLQRWVGIAPPTPIAGVSDPLMLPAYIPARTFALTMIDLLNREKLNGQNPVQNITVFLRDHHQEFEHNKAVEALLALVVDANNNVEKLQRNLENWFNDGMDRVSGWYKKYTQKVLLVIGLVLAIAFNVDAIRVAHTLWFDRDARQGMVSAANDYMQQHQAPGTNSTSPDEIAQRMRNSVSAFRDVSNETLLPIGWRHTPQEYWNTLLPKSAPDRARTIRWTALGALLATMAGWLITAGALSLGAPFWFDILNKFMVVRSTIKPQEKSQIEKSKDN